jgi:hypothetical protein
MGSYVKGILGSFSGKIGTVIGSYWKGISYMRSLPGKRRGTPSSSQVEQQLKFAIMIKFHEAFHSLVIQTFETVSKNMMMSPTNFAIRQNLKEAISGVYPDFSVDYHKVLLSMGKLHNAGGGSVEGAGAGKIKFSWINNSGTEDTAKATDKAILVAYCAETNEAVYTLAGAARSAETDTLNVSLFGGKGVETWIAFVSEDGTKFSRSSYLGNVMVE